MDERRLGEAIRKSDLEGYTLLCLDDGTRNAPVVTVGGDCPAWRYLPLGFPRLELHADRVRVGYDRFVGVFGAGRARCSVTDRMVMVMHFHGVFPLGGPDSPSEFP